MSETPTCATCRYFDRTGSGYGWCRRYAPRSYVGIEHRDEAAASYFPLVAEDDWCGEWQETAEAEPTRVSQAQTDLDAMRQRHDAQMRAIQDSHTQAIRPDRIRMLLETRRLLGSEGGPFVAPIRTALDGELWDLGIDPETGEPLGTPGGAE